MYLHSSQLLTEDEEGLQGLGDGLFPANDEIIQVITHETFLRASGNH